MIARIATALVLFPLVIWVVHLGGWAFGATIVGVTTLAVHEHANMVLPKNERIKGLWLAVLAAALAVCVVTGLMAQPLAVAVFGVLPILVLLPFLFSTGPMETVASRALMALGGLWWIGGLFLATISLRFFPDGDRWIYLVVILAFGTDTGAYFAGRFLGSRKLYPKVSPNKTWEGAIGGTLIGTGLAFAVNHYLGPGIDPLHLAVLAPVASALGQTGDLAESMLKRSVGVKDSGNIMPGHGGMFDRIDALMFVGVPFFVYAAGVKALSPTWLSF